MPLYSSLFAGAGRFSEEGSVPMAKWFGRLAPPKSSIFGPFASREYPKPFRFGYISKNQ